MDVFMLKIDSKSLFINTCMLQEVIYKCTLIPKQLMPDFSETKAKALINLNAS